MMHCETLQIILILHADPRESMTNTTELNATSTSNVPRATSGLRMRTVYVITPTYARSTQAPDLTRMCQTLMVAKQPLHWILVEDRNSTSTWVRELLLRSGLPYTHLALNASAAAPRAGSGHKKCRGMPQRNLALQWLRKHVADEDGVFYFGDDDNSYNLELFNEVPLRIYSSLLKGITWFNMYATIMHTTSLF